MSPLGHRIYIAVLTAIVVAVFCMLSYKGYSYYSLPEEERFYHPDHNNFKPSGVYGHGLGIVGTLLILIGVFGYRAKKKYRALAKFGRLKYWLEFHIFLCTLGPVMILFHTAFKMGGLVSVSFWSMVAVVASGVIGRFIYIQIPRTVDGRELSVHEIADMKVNVEEVLKERYGLSPEHFQSITQALSPQTAVGGGNIAGAWLGRYFEDRKTLRTVQVLLQQSRLSGTEATGILSILRRELTINRKMAWLHTMRRLFKYWHVAHLPFAIIMLVIMLIHVGVTLAFGYRWIF